VTTLKNLWALLLCGLLALPQGVLGQAVIPERFLTGRQVSPKDLEVRVERGSEGLFLSAVLPPLTLSNSMRAALDKGIPMVFTLQARVLLPRWYWSDQLVAEARRYVRLSYQPLTRRWRVTHTLHPLAGLASGADFSGLHSGLGQTFDDMSAAVAALQRIVRWQIAPGDVAGQDKAYVVKFQFHLDVSQLPRLLQIGMRGHQSWGLQWTRSVEVPGHSRLSVEAKP